MTTSSEIDHSSREHAVLSASGSARWIQCPASIRMEEHAPPQKESVWAREGTSAHELAELKLRCHTLEEISVGVYLQRRAEWTQAQRDEEWLAAEPAALEAIDFHTDAFQEYVEMRLQSGENGVLFVEQRLSSGLPQSWGTSDVVIMWPDTVEIIDFKYGSGVRVDAAGNSQLRIYALGALDEFGDIIGDTKHVRMTVFQPRLDWVDTDVMDADELREWREEIRPIAERALGDDAEFGPSPEACRWCPAAGVCRARVEHETRGDFMAEPDALTPEELGELLGRLPSIRAWVNAVEKASLDLAFSGGTHIPGWKVVRSGGRRVITDHSAAIDLLCEAGFSSDDVMESKLTTLGRLDALTKELGTSLGDILGDLLIKTEGRESLVPEEDPREAISPETGAASDFDVEPDTGK